MKFLLIGGEHRDSTRVYQKNDVIESDLNLIAMFPNKFKRAEAVAEVAEGTPITAETGVVARSVETETEDDPVVAGKNVTDKFEAASNNDLTVWFKAGDGYVVKDGDKVVNDKKLKSKTDVIHFLTTFLEENE